MNAQKAQNGEPEPKKREELVTAKYAENRREFNRKERRETPQALVFVLLAFFVAKGFSRNRTFLSYCATKRRAATRARISDRKDGE
jgi:hypothetical protein